MKHPISILVYCGPHPQRWPGLPHLSETELLRLLEQLQRKVPPYRERSRYQPGAHGKLEVFNGTRGQPGPRT